jgi:thioesterase domain-containing protein
LLGVGPELGWRAYATQGIQAFDVPGDHYSLLQEPYIGVLAATLKQCLDEAEGSAAT